ncbi:MAG: RNA polymerase sigma-54 factor, partial [Planctomycetales bacterium]
MRLSFGQEFHQQQRQEQRQILAPRMIQSMEILQLPIMALQKRIQQEMEENPVLGLLETDPDLPEPPVEERENPDAPTQEETELVVDENHKEDDFDRLDRLVNLSEEWDEHFEGNNRPSANRMQEDADRKHDAMANLTSRPQTLQDYLCDQLAWFDIDPPMRKMTERIIYNLSSTGYLQGTLENLLDPNAGPEDAALAQAALKLVQHLDPPGVGARNLRECLLMQL